MQSQDAEDFTQDIFIKLTDSLCNFEGRSTFKTYLDRIIKNKLIDYYRGRKKFMPLEEKIFENPQIDPKDGKSKALFSKMKS